MSGDSQLQANLEKKERPGFGSQLLPILSVGGVKP